MTSTPGYFDRKPSSSIRPGLSHLQASPSSPHTPRQQRSGSSALGSPSLSYRAEEDALVFEFGTRHFSAGFTGDSYPRCTLGFGPEESRRVGDYRKWLPDYDKRPRKRKRVTTWGDDRELWRMDLRKFDLGIVEDKVERAAREAYTKYLILDSKARRLLVVIPSIIPHQLLSTLLSTLFNNFFVPSITLLSPPILSTLSSGCRSGLIVDIGWRETLVTGVYEFREVSQHRTTRAMRSVTLEMARILERHDEKKGPSVTPSSKGDDEENSFVSVDLEQAEEATVRMAWCQSLQTKGEKLSNKPPDVSNRAGQMPIAEDTPNHPSPTNKNLEDPLLSIPSPSSPRQSIQIPFSQFAEPAEITLLAKSRQDHDLDDHEQPLHLLIYNSLLHLPPDVRALCMSRIMFTGGGSNIPGLKSRLLDEVAALVEQRDWDPVIGPAADKARLRLKEISHNQRVTPKGTPNSSARKLASSSEDPDPIDDPKVPASQEPQVKDQIDDKFQRDKEKKSKTVVSGIVRGVETLGPWAGASLLANLRIKGIVDIDRDSFLQHGLAGARKEAEINVAPQKNMPRAGMGEKVGWTLGAWA